MIIFPAVDLQHGKAVRLKQGIAHESTVFADDPVEAACQWEARGARWLHVVDLDGAFEGSAKSRSMVRRICGSLHIPVQLGGGIRDMKTAADYLEGGVTRIIIGTLALEQPEIFREICLNFPGRVGVSLDAADGKLKSRGWTAGTHHTVDDVLPRIEDNGAAFIIYTDISRDGMQSGVNLPALEHLTHRAHIPVIAAGGVATLADVQQLYPLSVSSSLEGVISGRALYTGTLRLEEANAWLESRDRHRR